MISTFVIYSVILVTITAFSLYMLSMKEFSLGVLLGGALEILNIAGLSFSIGRLLDAGARVSITFLNLIRLGVFLTLIAAGIRIANGNVLAIAAGLTLPLIVLLIVAVRANRNI